MKRTGALEEPISPELVLVDEDLAARARAALPDPPWLQPAVAEARQRVEVTQAVAVEEPPAPEVSRGGPRPSLSSHLRATVVFGCALVALVALVSLALELVAHPARPTLATRRAESEAPALPKKSTSKQAAKRAKVQSAVKPKPARKAKSKPKPMAPRSPKRSKSVPTRSAKRSTPLASAPKHAAKPKARAAVKVGRAAVKVERVFSWRLYRGAAYYQVYLRRGAATVYEARTLKRTTSIRLKLRPGRYHAFVRPAISTDAGIILGPAIMDKIVRV